MNKISDHISYKEATKSNTAIRHGIDNTPDECTILRMKQVADNVFEKVRTHFNVPIAVSSFYRSEEVNTKIGGSSKSQHCKGEAIDIDADVYGKITNADIFNYIYENLDYDQLIWEFGEDEPAWVHVSYKTEGNKKQTLKAYKENGRTKYKYYGA